MGTHLASRLLMALFLLCCTHATAAAQSALPSEDVDSGNTPLTKAIARARLIGEQVRLDKADGKPLDPKAVEQLRTAIEDVLLKGPQEFVAIKLAYEYSFMLDRYDDAVEHLNKLLDTDEGKQDARLWVDLASCLSKSGKAEEAQRLAEKLIGYDPTEGVFTESDALAIYEVTGYSLLAAVYERQGRLDDASAVLEQMIRLNSENEAAYMARGMFLYRCRRDPAAVDDIRQALALTQDDETTLLSAGNFLMRTGNDEESRACFERLVIVNPENVGGYLGLSYNASSSGDNEKALEYADQALGLAPNLVSAIWRCAVLQLQLKLLSQAEESLTRLKEAGCNESFCDFLDGRIRLARKDWSLAAQKLTKARPWLDQFQPRWVDALDLNLAKCYEKLGEPKRALEVVDRILAKDQGNAPARIKRARANLALGEKAKAIDDYDWLRDKLVVEDIWYEDLPLVIELEILTQLAANESQRDWEHVTDLLRALGEKPYVTRSTYAESLIRYLDASGKAERAARVREFEAKRTKPKKNDGGLIDPFSLDN